ncbi:transcriptional regulator, TetR family [Frankineae bacterium MT45]|nr:transcriptional regulator, TetR family [Frankineae bacterium MT45]
MPRNRAPVDRAEKRDEIVAAAERLFTTTGYDETPIVRVAREVGVTTNTIYWYFDDKDALLVAVLDRVLAQAIEELGEQPEQAWSERVLWAVQRLQHYERLVTVVHARIASSRSIEVWHNQFHSMVDAMMEEGFRAAGARPKDVPALTRMSALVIEGVLTHPYDEGDKGQSNRAVIELLTTGFPKSTSTFPKSASPGR